MIVGPRVEFDLDHYPRIRVWDSDEQRDHYLYLHRLTAFAHGEIDDLWSSLHVHHVDEDKWNNDPQNLEARPPADHCSYHLNGGVLS